jgi:hypothetical protein
VVSAPAAGLARRSIGGFAVVAGSPLAVAASSVVATYAATGGVAVSRYTQNAVY